MKLLLLLSISLLLLAVCFADDDEEVSFADDDPLSIFADEETIEEITDEIPPSFGPTQLRISANEKKSKFQKTTKFDPIACTIEPPPSIDELNAYYEWMDKHEKSWKDAEERMCKTVRVIDNMRDIAEHNERFEAGEETFTRAAWEGSDLTFEEKKEKYLMKDVKDFKWRSLPVPTAPFPTSTPLTLNYTAQGLVSPVRNQGSCGCCYAFGAAHAIEGQLRKCGISTATVSVQPIVDCSTVGTWGCNGGWPYWSYKWAQSIGVIPETAYKYTALKGTCNYNSSSIIAYIDGAYNYDSSVTANLMKQALAAVGPLAIVLCVDNSFFSYASGVYKIPTCCTAIQHVVTAVGYGNDPVAGDYWIIKNSWGTTWGMQGYIHFSRGTNLCQIENQFSYPSVRRLDGTLCP